MKTKLNTKSLLAVAGCVFANVAYAGTCDTTIANLVSWLNQSPLNHVTATIASNRPPQSLPQPNSTKSQVTYSQTELQKAGAWVPGGLFAPSAGTLYYDDRFWKFPSSDPTDFSVADYPFDPNSTSKLGLIITATGTVYVNPGSASQSFSAACAGGVMFGAPAVGGIAAQLAPMYTVTFRQWVLLPDQSK